MSRRQYRKRRQVEDEEEHEAKEKSVSEMLEEAKEIQSFRKKPSGISAIGLAFGKKFTEEEKLAPDPFKLKTGGLVDLKTLDPAEVKNSAEDEVVKRLTSQFSAETQTRDDETHMLKYIDDEIAKRKGKQDEETVLSEYEAKIASLYKLPDKYQVDDSKRSEDMLSNQMLSGIPEVDLGLDAKFKNIEETEIAKKKMAEDKLKMKDKQTSMIPTNFASNFTLHSLRFFKDRGRGHRGGGGRGGGKRREEEEPESHDQPSFIPVVGSFDEPELKPTARDDGGGATGTKKRKPAADHSQLPTDDYHFDKFRKKAKSHR